MSIYSHHSNEYRTTSCFERKIAIRNEKNFFFLSFQYLISMRSVSIRSFLSTFSFVQELMLTNSVYLCTNVSIEYYGHVHAFNKVVNFKYKYPYCVYATRCWRGAVHRKWWICDRYCFVKIQLSTRMKFIELKTVKSPFHVVPAVICGIFLLTVNYIHIIHCLQTRSHIEHLTLIFKYISP